MPIFLRKDKLPVNLRLNVFTEGFNLRLWSPEKRGRTFRIALSPAQAFQNQIEYFFQKLWYTNKIYLRQKLQEITNAPASGSHPHANLLGQVHIILFF